MTADVDVRPAVALSESDLRALFNAAYSDYQVALQLSPAAFRGHVINNDIDLGRSRVAVAERAAALALIARRGNEAWVGGVGTIPTCRRLGLGERVLVQGLHAAQEAGVRTVWLEVLEGNDAALRLYEKLGFATARMLRVVELEACDSEADPLPPADLDEAHAWIVASRAARDPWQRADASLRRMREHGSGLGATALSETGSPTAAVIYRPETEPVTVLQWATRDDEAAARLVAGLRRERSLRLSNVPDDDPLSAVLDELGAQVVAWQLEMRLSL